MESRLSFDFPSLGLDVALYLPAMCTSDMGSGMWGWGVALLLVVLAGCRSDAGDAGPRSVEGWQFQDTTGQWRTADVPGCIHTDLLAHGIIASPFLQRNEEDVQWIEDRDWTYRTVMTPPQGEGDWALEFKGLDTYAEVSVNGSGVLRTDNMHRSWRIPMDRLGLTGWDTLQVRFESPVRRGQALLDASPWPVPASNEARPIAEQTSAMSRKAMYHFGWDWGPRLVTSGIWKPVQWVRIDLELPSFRLTPVSIDSSRAEYRIEWDAPVEGLTASLSREDVPVSMEWAEVSPGVHEMVIDNPALWWPNGLGEQPLYTLEFQDELGRTRSWRFGVRTVEWNRSPDAIGNAMQCVVNGIPVQARGANVIPPDFFPVRAEGQWGRVVDDAVEAHMNMLRVWGGAHYGDEAFYDLCDERGLLVWQDFMNACAMVPGDAAWRDNFLAEAEEQVVRLRNRTSLAIWAGNNESEKAWRDWGWQDLYGLHGADSVAVEQAYRSVFEEALPEAVRRLGGGEYQPSSPHNLNPERPRESGDQHDWGVWFGKTGFEYYSEEAGRFASEFGLQSVPDRRTLAEAGVVGLDDPVLQFRQRCTMDWLEPGFDGWDMMRHYAGLYFSDPESVDVDSIEGWDSLDAWIYLTQLTQAEGLRQAVERHRCSAGRTSGSLYWQLDDVWPTVSWSTVDHAGRWKLAHHAVRHANQPLRVMPNRIQGDAVAFRVINDRHVQAKGVLSWALVSLSGDTAASGRFGLTVGPMTSTAWQTDEVRVLPESQVLAWRWTAEDDGGEILDEGSRTFRPVGEMDWMLPGELDVQVDDEGVTLETRVPVPGVWLRSAEEGRFEDNGFTLMPGRPRTIRFMGPSGEAASPGEVSVVHFGQLQARRP